LNVFSWNKVVRSDSTGSPSGARAEKDWEPLKSLDNR